MRRAWQAWIRAILLSLAVCWLALLVVPIGSTAGPTAGPTVFVDPDTQAKMGADVNWVFTWIGDGKYQLDVQNTSGIGYVNTFEWTPPAGMTITAVTSTNGGSCVLTSGNISCTGNIAPPVCTCKAGGDMVIKFTATGLAPTTQDGYRVYYGIVGAQLLIQSMTPVTYHIPSWLGGVSGSQGAQADLPQCQKGKVSTKAHPCAKQ